MKEKEGENPARLASSWSTGRTHSSWGKKKSRGLLLERRGPLHLDEFQKNGVPVGPHLRGKGHQVFGESRRDEKKKKPICTGEESKTNWVLEKETFSAPRKKREMPIALNLTFCLEDRKRRMTACCSESGDFA